MTYNLYDVGKRNISNYISNKLISYYEIIILSERDSVIREIIVRNLTNRTFTKVYATKISRLNLIIFELGFRPAKL